jgi:D-arabinose 1-dehydrogenase-like Zn-dependent alcohol dehydrogenase
MWEYDKKLKILNVEHDVRPWIEMVTMEQVNAVIQKVRDGKVGDRMVLEAQFD